jgi:hypothetical protein
LQSQLADGLSITVDLCTGLSRFALGRKPKGQLNTPDAGETKRVPTELQPGALMVFGPQIVGEAGFTANIDAPGAKVHVALACRDQAEALAAAYVEGRPLPTITTLAEKDLRSRDRSEDRSSRAGRRRSRNAATPRRPRIESAPCLARPSRSRGGAPCTGRRLRADSGSVSPFRCSLAGQAPRGARAHRLVRQARRPPMAARPRTLRP